MIPKKVRKILYIYLAAVLLLAVGLIAIEKSGSLLNPTEVVKYGDLKVSENVDGILIRNEKVFLAKQNMEVSFKAGEGDLLKRRELIGEESEYKFKNSEKDSLEKKYKTIKSNLGNNTENDIDLKANYSALISYSIDGYENKLNAGNMKKIDSSDFQRSYETFKTQGKALEGQPIYKLVKNEDWYMAAFVKKENKARYKVGERIIIEIGNKEINAEVVYKKETGEKPLIILKSNEYFDGLLSKRKCSAKIVSMSERGLIVKNTAIVKNGEQKGVYLKTRSDDFVFTPVDVKTTDGKVSAVAQGSFETKDGKVYNTISAYDEVLIDPERYTGSVYK